MPRQEVVGEGTGSPDVVRACQGRDGLVQTVPEDMARMPLGVALQATLVRARDHTTHHGHAEITLEHLLLALSEDEDASVVLRACNIDLDRLRDDIAAHIATQAERGPAGMRVEPRISAGLTQILRYAGLAAQQGRRPRIDGAIVLAAIVGDGRSAAAGFLKSQGLTFDAAIRALQQAAPGTGAATAAGSAPAGANAVATRATEPPARAAHAEAARRAGGTYHDTEDILAAARVRVQSRSGPQRTETSPDETAEGPPGAPTPVPPPAHHRADAAAPVTAAGAPPSSGAGPKPTVAAPQDTQPPPMPMNAEPQASPASDAGSATQRHPTAPSGPPPLPSADGPSTAPTGAAVSPVPAPVVPPPLPAQSIADAAPSPPHAGAGPAWAPPPLPSMPPRADRAPPPPPPSMAPQVSPPMAPPPQISPMEGPRLDGLVSEPMRGAGMSPSRAPPAYPQAPPASHRQTPSGPRPGPGPSGPAPGPPGRQHGGDPTRSSPRRPAIEPAQVTHTIAPRMSVGVARVVEVRIARTPLVAGTPATQPYALRGEVASARAISVRLRPMQGAFLVDATSPETQWERSMTGGRLSGDTAVWRFLVTPMVPGTGELSLHVAAHVMSAEGILAETVLPEQIVPVRIGKQLSRTLRRYGRLLLVALGGAIIVEIVRAAHNFGVLATLTRLIGM